MDAFFPLLLIVAGAILAFAGRRMIHLAIAIAGFMLFYLLAVTLLPASGSLVQLLVGVLGGLLGAWLATRFFRLVVAIAGFLFAGWIGMSLAETLGWTGTSATLVFLAAGIIGLILVGTVFDTTMILLTAISGAMLLLNGLDELTSISALETYRIPLLILLAGVGAYVQWRTRR